MNIQSARSALYKPPRIAWLGMFLEVAFLVGASVVLVEFALV